jgi:hypothetical protein
MVIRCTETAKAKIIKFYLYTAGILSVDIPYGTVHDRNILDIRKYVLSLKKSKNRHTIQVNNRLWL